jgi:protein-tyrosine phosphatase
MNLRLKQYLPIILAIFLLATCENKSEQKIADSTDLQRQIELEGQPNFRDLGGYKTTDGRTVKWGQIYRSGELPRLTDQDVKKLDSLELNTVINFLTPKELETHGQDRLPDGVNSLSLPMNSKQFLGDLAAEILVARQTGNFMTISPDLNPQIHRLLIEHAREEYAEVLRSALNMDRRPLVFHCSHGIHRTGTAAALLLSALGVPWDTIREDYLLSNKYRKDEISRRLKELKELARSNPEITDHEQNDKNIEAFYVLQGSYVDAALDEAVKQYGSMENYIRDGLGISDEVIAMLKDQLLE